MIRNPKHERTRSLGWLVLAWIEHFVVHGPGDVQGQPVVHGDEYSAFIADCYAVDEDGKRFYDSAFISRPKGCDKSGLGARLVLAEAFGPVRFAGFAEGGEVYRDRDFAYEYEPGEPMGQRVLTPMIRVMATEENQTGNTYDSVYFNLTDGPLADTEGLARNDVGLTRVLLPGGGEIMPSTASGASKDGGKETFVVFDESHLYNTPELRRMYAFVTQNLVKRRRSAGGTWFLETTTMYQQGEDSVAEGTMRTAGEILEGRYRGRPARVLFDHRWGEIADLSDIEELRTALLDAYGDAAAWVDVDAVIDQIFDPPQRRQPVPALLPERADLGQRRLGDRGGVGRLR